MLIIYKMTLMEDRELFRVLKEGNRQKDCDTTLSNTHARPLYITMGGWGRRSKQALMNTEIL
jgi:hypothetical protein